MTDLNQSEQTEYREGWAESPGRCLTLIGIVALFVLTLFPIRISTVGARGGPDISIIYTMVLAVGMMTIAFALLYLAEIIHSK